MNHIFKQPKKDIQEQYYCNFGIEDYIDDNGYARLNTLTKDVVAKAVCNKKSKHFTDNLSYYRYYVKMSPNMELFNPIKIHSTENNNKQEFTYINKVCKGTWDFKEVDKLIFDQYLLFLKTKNLKTFKDIQRQIK